MPSRSSATLKLENEESAKPWQPEPYMKRAVKFLLEHAAGGLLLDPGLRKTSITLAAIKILKSEGVLRRALVIAPLRPCYQVWPKELRKWLDFCGLTFEILHGPKKDAAIARDADIYIINPDGLKWLFSERRFEQLGVDTAIVDESSKFKHTRTQRFKQLKPYLLRFKRRWILTGSPAPRGYEDLFGQMYIVDLGRSLGPFITHYRMQYFFQTGFGGYTWKLQPGADARIQARIKPLVMRLDAEDYVKMPVLLDNVIRVELPEKVRKIYDDMEEELFAQIGEREIMALNSAAAMVKCRQVASGGVYRNILDGERTRREVIQLHEEKTDALVDLIDELNGQQILVAYDFEHDLERIRGAIGKDTPHIGSGVSPKRSAEIENEWNAGNVHVLLGHPQSMGHGLNLQESNAHHVAWYSLIWDFDLYDQFNRRVRRSGNTSARVTVHHILARATVDEAIFRALKVKNKTQRALLDALRSYRARRT